MLLMTNVDNIYADQIPYLIESLLTKGAKNVHVLNAMTKKGRPEYIFFIDVEMDKVSLISRFLAMEIGTIGIRIIKAEHLAFDYSMESIKFNLKDEKGKKIWQGQVGVKIIYDQENSPLSARVEYEDLKITAQLICQAGVDISLYELKQIIEGEAIKKIKKNKYQIQMEGD